MSMTEDWRAERGEEDWQEYERWLDEGEKDDDRETDE
jgi:hypothetical protein